MSIIAVAGLVFWEFGHMDSLGGGSRVSSTEWLTKAFARYTVSYPQNTALHVAPTTNDDFIIVSDNPSPEAIAIRVIPKTSAMKAATTVDGLAVIVSQDPSLVGLYCDVEFWQLNFASGTSPSPADQLGCVGRQRFLYALPYVHSDNARGKATAHYFYNQSGTETDFDIVDLGDSVGMLQWGWKGVRTDDNFVQIWNRIRFL